MVKGFSEACGKEIPYKMCERRAGDLATVVCNPAKANSELGWKTERGLKDMCADAWRWQSNIPAGYEAK